MPKQKLYSQINAIRITPNGNLTFIVEDTSKISIYLYDLNEKRLENNSEPLLEFNK